MFVVGGQQGCEVVDVVHHDGGLAGLVAEQAIARGSFGRILQEEDSPGTAEVTSVGAEVTVSQTDGACVCVCVCVSVRVCVRVRVYLRVVCVG